ncbi:PEP-CTERM sorting domain-containing protein [Roseomonas haemaphysalidis]|uniref:PEP-CTERM sorting domain-containing protein n=1 Tax=Roseomonas haemaphysalidis TaxID=2768162 RepID=A0ABS3KW94_9PROT|nr:PEP-CTERM sorting domain-containing protein [Roseomonas haemaphysalidis]MBO1081709.1 PEP-CTERM sorting domain-containing protein [Roseomonas haemaphysalidis]
MRGWIVAGLLALGLASGSAGTAQAGPYLGGTLDVRIGSAYYNLITGQGGSFAAVGQTQAVAGDPGRFLLPITQDESTGRADGFAAIGSGIALRNAVDGSSVFSDFGQAFPSLPASFYTVSTGDPICSVLLENVSILANDGTIGLGGSSVSRTDSENAYYCFRGRNVAIGGQAVLNTLESTDYARLPFFVITPIAAPVTVPEPGTLALLALPMGALGLLVTRRRREVA